MGVTAGFRGGLWDEALMRLSTALQAFPSILLALLLAAVWEPGVQAVLWAVAIGNIPSFLRLTRSQVLSIKKRPYVEAARALGPGPAHYAAPCHSELGRCPLGPVFSESGRSHFSGGVPELSGVGVQPPVPSWGRMLREAQPTRPWPLGSTGSRLLYRDCCHRL